MTGTHMPMITENNQRWWALGAVSVCLFMISLDNTVETVALRGGGNGAVPLGPA